MSDKTLYLLRHAQAEAHGPQGDISRPLSGKGRADARAVGELLSGAGIEVALVSAATRTRQTFAELGLDCHAEFMEALYQAGTDEMAQRISEIDDQVTSLLVVGHSPTIPSLAAELLYASAPDRADDLQCHYPTATVTALRTSGPWAELGQHPVELVTVTRR